MIFDHRQHWHHAKLDDSSIGQLEKLLRAVIWCQTKLEAESWYNEGSSFWFAEIGDRTMFLLSCK